ncbi:hypothetical protein IE53DRAFT_389289 [Violaceomyces palustris]|uniref:Uncharacterized protein n=1 Tax=Violaceomyces palustris TaxID=1673888 RepID=A0ACD0NRQ7_9BASI|nr:hypothetical protein IE53DRAFT_389289 [Violaceomyces palustris]
MADKLTRVALDQIKKWLRGNTSSRELGDSLKGEIGNLVSGFSSMLKGNKSSASQAARAAGGDRDQTEKQGGVSGLISRKLSTGLSKVHKDVRIEFRTVLAAVEKDLFEALPGQIQSPLQKILGGNPFDLGNNPQSRDRGVISDKLAESVTRLINKVQSSLRERVLMVVSGGHRRLEAASWGFVQNKVEEKVQRFLPNVKIVIKEGEDGDQKPPPQVGAPTSSGQAGGYPNASPPSFPNPPTSTQGQAQVLAYQQQQQTPAHPPPPLQGMPTQNYGYVNVANLAQPQSGQAHWSGGGTQEQQTPSHHPQGAFPQPWSGPSFDRGFGEGRNLQSEQRETKPSAAASMPNAPMGFGFVGGGGDGGGSGSTYPNQANPARNDDPPPPNANDRGFEIQPTQRFRSSKPRSGARLQDSVVDEWDKDDGGDEEVEEHQTYDPEMEWKRA